MSGFLRRRAAGVPLRDYVDAQDRALAERIGAAHARIDASNERVERSTTALETRMLELGAENARQSSALSRQIADLAERVAAQGGTWSGVERALVIVCAIAAVLVPLLLRAL